jgi:hypothetical protein
VQPAESGPAAISSMLRIRASMDGKLLDADGLAKVVVVEDTSGKFSSIYISYSVTTPYSL